MIGAARRSRTRLNGMDRAHLRRVGGNKTEKSSSVFLKRCIRYHRLSLLFPNLPEMAIRHRKQRETLA